MKNRSAAQLEEEQEEEAGHLPARLQLAPVGERESLGGGKGCWWLSSHQPTGALRPLITPQDNNAIALICVAQQSRSGQVSLPSTWPAMSNGLKGQSNSELKFHPFAPLISDKRQFTGPNKHRACAALFNFPCFMRGDRVNQSRQVESFGREIHEKTRWIQLIFHHTTQYAMYKQI